MDFLEALLRHDREKTNLVIPDIKCFSPKEGDLLRGRDPVALARALVSAGAPALSVVTEEREFHGSVELLKQICAAVDVPVLRKDFVTGPDDLRQTAQAGASAILLMYSTLGRERLHELYREALRLGLTPFVETHTAQELEWAGELGTELVGINNRDILRLERDDGDVSRTAGLIAGAPKGSLVISESSIRNGDEVRLAVSAGAGGALVGTAILQAPDPAEMYRALTAKTGLKVCGLTDSEGIALFEKYAVDILGFVVEYPEDVPWNLTLERARPLIEAARRGGGETAVVAGGGMEKVLSVARALHPDYIQIHHRETLRQSAEIASELKKMGIRAIRSIPTGAQARERMFGTADPVEIVRLIDDSDLYAALFDSRDADNAGAGGGSIDSGAGGDIAGAIKSAKKPVLLGGGITYRNAGEIIRRFGPAYIDVMTGVELSPGKKSEELLRKLVENTRNPHA